MPAVFRHFAINADDVARAKQFYEQVFGWTFTPWGPPDFYQVNNAGSGVKGALQARRSLNQGARTNALETTMGVDDLNATLATVRANGGKMLMPPFRIEGVGELSYFEDPEGNIVGAMQYDAGVWSS